MRSRFIEFFMGRRYAHYKRYEHIKQKKKHHNYIIKRKNYYNQRFTHEELKLERLYIQHKLATNEQIVGPLYWYIFSIFFSATLTFAYHAPKSLQDQLINEMVIHMIDKEGERLADILLQRGDEGFIHMVKAIEKMSNVEVIYEGSMEHLFYTGIDIILILFAIIIISLIIYGFANRRRAASLKFNLMIVEEILKDYDNKENEKGADVNNG